MKRKKHLKHIKYINYLNETATIGALNIGKAAAIGAGKVGAATATTGVASGAGTGATAGAGIAGLSALGLSGKLIKKTSEGSFKDHISNSNNQNISQNILMKDKELYNEIFNKTKQFENSKNLSGVYDHGTTVGYGNDVRFLEARDFKDWANAKSFEGTPFQSKFKQWASDGKFDKNEQQEFVNLVNKNHLTPEQMNTIYKHEFDERILQLKNTLAKEGIDFSSLPANVKKVLIDFNYNAGTGNLLKTLKAKGSIEDLKSGDYNDFANDIKTSNWYNNFLSSNIDRHHYIDGNLSDYV